MDKRTDINTASFAYSVSLLRIRISGYPPGAGTKRQSIHTAVLHGINGIKGLEKESFVLLEQIRTLDKGRLDDFVGRLNREQMIKVDKALRTSMEIKKLDKPILMCLCPVCAKPFYNSKEHFIIRADQEQIIKETCMFCNVRQGYDYLIRKKYY